MGNIAEDVQNKLWTQPAIRVQIARPGEHNWGAH